MPADAAATVSLAEVTVFGYQVGPEEVSAADKETNQKVLGYLSEFAALPTPTVRANPLWPCPCVPLFLPPACCLASSG